LTCAIHIGPQQVPEHGAVVYRRQADHRRGAGRRSVHRAPARARRRAPDRRSNRAGRHARSAGPQRSA
jgi:hypothetical protein